MSICEMDYHFPNVSAGPRIPSTAFDAIASIGSDTRLLDCVADEVDAFNLVDVPVIAVDTICGIDPDTNDAFVRYQVYSGANKVDYKELCNRYPKAVNDLPKGADSVISVVFDSSDNEMTISATDAQTHTTWPFGDIDDDVKDVVSRTLNRLRYAPIAHDIGCFVADNKSMLQMHLDPDCDFDVDTQRVVEAAFGNWLATANVTDNQELIDTLAKAAWMNTSPYKCFIAESADTPEKQHYFEGIMCSDHILNELPESENNVRKFYKDLRATTDTLMRDYVSTLEMVPDKDFADTWFPNKRTLMWSAIDDVVRPQILCCAVNGDKTSDGLYEGIYDSEFIVDDPDDTVAYTLADKYRDCEQYQNLESRLSLAADKEWEIS